MSEAPMLNFAALRRPGATDVDDLPLLDLGRSLLGNLGSIESLSKENVAIYK